MEKNPNWILSFIHTPYQLHSSLFFIFFFSVNAVVADAVYPKTEWITFYFFFRCFSVFRIYCARRQQVDIQKSFFLFSHSLLSFDTYEYLWNFNTGKKSLTLLFTWTENHRVMTTRSKKIIMKTYKINEKQILHLTKLMSTMHQAHQFSCDISQITLNNTVQTTNSRNHHHHHHITETKNKKAKHINNIYMRKNAIYQYYMSTCVSWT